MANFKTCWKYQHAGEEEKTIMKTYKGYHYLDHPTMGGCMLIKPTMQKVIDDLRSWHDTRVWKTTENAKTQEQRKPIKS